MARLYILLLALGLLCVPVLWRCATKTSLSSVRQKDNLDIKSVNDIRELKQNDNVKKASIGSRFLNLSMDCKVIQYAEQRTNLTTTTTLQVFRITCGSTNTRIQTTCSFIEEIEPRRANRVKMNIRIRFNLESDQENCTWNEKKGGTLLNRSGKPFQINLNVSLPANTKSVCYRGNVFLEAIFCSILLVFVVNPIYHLLI